VKFAYAARNIGTEQKDLNERRIAAATTYSEFVDAVRARVTELGIGYERIDDLAGFQAGYTAKLLGPARVKHFGEWSFTTMLNTLGLAIIIVEDKPLTELMRHRWTKAGRLSTADARQPSIALVKRVKPAVLSEMGRAGGRNRQANLGPEGRKRFAQTIAFKRWGRPNWRERLRRRRRKEKRLKRDPPSEP
jgi:hypothetical protein